MVRDNAYSWSGSTSSTPCRKTHPLFEWMTQNPSSKNVKPIHFANSRLPEKLYIVHSHISHINQIVHFGWHFHFYLRDLGSSTQKVDGFFIVEWIGSCHPGIFIGMSWWIVFFFFAFCRRRITVKPHRQLRRLRY